MQTFDHIIVGGGVVGASIAYHLVSKGSGKVLLLERNELASAASSRAAGLVLQTATKLSKTPLARLTTHTVSILEADLGESVGYHEVGSLRIAASSGRVSELDAMVGDASNWNIPTEYLSKKDVEGLVPWVNIDSIQKAAFFPTDGYIDPYILTMSYIRAARKRGAVVRSNSPVEDVILKNGRVVGIRTDFEEISCVSVIDACGAWAALLSERIGYALPMAPVRSHYWIAEANKIYGGEHPVTVIPDIAAYTRPEVGGLVLGVQEAHSATFNARDLPDDPATFSPTKGEEHWDVLADAYDGLSRFFPAIDKARFSSYVSGLSSYTPDGEIILGPIPGVSGFYAAAGDCGSGITLSAGMGDVMADLVLGHEPVFDISRLKPDRFGLVDPFSEVFQLRCAAARASKSRSSSKN